jgi:hypothetical protein
MAMQIIRCTVYPLLILFLLTHKGMLHCPSCSCELVESANTGKDGFAVWWKCIKYGEFFQMMHLKKLIMTA